MKTIIEIESDKVTDEQRKIIEEEFTKMIHPWQEDILKAVCDEHFRIIIYSGRRTQ